MDYVSLPAKLVYYAKRHLGLEDLDAVYAKNLIMAALNLFEPEDVPLSDTELEEIDGYEVPDVLVWEVMQCAKRQSLCPEGMEESFAAGIMGLLSPAPSALAANFDRFKEVSPQKACDYLYDISIKNNYIQKTAISKNLYWKKDFGDNSIEITINLSKPEKDNREIARMLAQPQASYPKCMLCVENMGFAGTLAKPPRQNLRIVPVTLDGAQWYLQYSPYLYYDRHCIVFSKEHTPMKVDASTPRKLCDFVREFPHFFVGSNASIPIVGGSILSHEHFQGGGGKLPLHHAGDLMQYQSGRFEDVCFSIVNWYNSVIRLRSENAGQLTAAAAALIEHWRGYNCEELGIISHTGQTGHNAVTPIMRLEDGVYILDMILRNNRTDTNHPDGIFHAHKQYHHIKKEGIGLIEAMGLFILPGRLKRETEEIAAILTGASQGAGLEIHRDMISTLKQQAGGIVSPLKANNLIRDYISETCRSILINTAVFKPDNSRARDTFKKFVEDFIK